MPKKKLAIVLGIRPDVIRASLILNSIRQVQEFEIVFIWTGQHYSDNLKDIFFRELGVAKPDVELNAGGETDAAIIASVVTRLSVAMRVWPSPCEPWKSASANRSANARGGPTSL